MGQTTLFAVSLALLLTSVSSSAQQPLTPISEHVNRTTGNSANLAPGQAAVVDMGKHVHLPGDQFGLRSRAVSAVHAPFQKFHFLVK